MTSEVKDSKPAIPAHNVVLYDLSDSLRRADLLQYTAAIESLTNEAFYTGREKKVKPENVQRAILQADAVILVLSEDKKTLMACMVGNIRRHFSGSSVFIDDVITAPPFQRNGIQSKMMDTMIAWAKDIGLERVALYTERTNEAAIASYTKKGFRDRHIQTIAMVRDL